MSVSNLRHLSLPFMIHDCQQVSSDLGMRSCESSASEWTQDITGGGGQEWVTIVRLCWPCVGLTPPHPGRPRSEAPVKCDVSLTPELAETRDTTGGRLQIFTFPTILTENNEINSCCQLKGTDFQYISNGPNLKPSFHGNYLVPLSQNYNNHNKVN